MSRSVSCCSLISVLFVSPYCGEPSIQGTISAGLIILLPPLLPPTFSPPSPPLSLPSPPLSPRALVNGVSATQRTSLAHGSRILLGNNHLFRLSCPGQSLKESETLMNYEQAMNEISLNELKDMPMYKRIQRKLLEKHDAEKEGLCN